MRQSQPDFARFIEIVCRQAEPTRVHLAELFHDQEVMAAIQGPPASDSVDDVAAWRAQFWLDMGYDYVGGNVDLGFAHGIIEAKDTAGLSRGERGWVNESTGPIGSWEEFDRYPWPEVTPAAFQSLEALGRHLPEGMKVATMIPGGPFENLTFLMGFEAFSYALVDQPDLVAAIVERIDQVLCQVVEATASMEWVGVQWINDDLGFKGGTLAAPEVLRQYVFPTQKKLAEIAHRHGKPVFLHSCGKLDAIMDELINDVGIDAKHSFEDVIEPVWEAKRKWGSRVGLLGGVDMDVLCRGTEEQVRAYTRRCIEECLPGGGWALGSGNTVANYMPPANFLAMLDEGRHYRRDP
jgi:uroporphyrinogen decarboxylase